MKIHTERERERERDRQTDRQRYKQKKIKNFALRGRQRE